MTYNISNDLENEGSCKISITELSNRIGTYILVRFKPANCHTEVLVIQFPTECLKKEMCQCNRSTKKQVLVNRKGDLTHLIIMFIVCPIFQRTVITLTQSVKCTPLRKPVFIPTQFYTVTCRDKDSYCKADTFTSYCYATTYETF